jgi:hypothetical protein
MQESQQQCDYCDEGLPIVAGRHRRIDPEGIEGIQIIPCAKIPLFPNPDGRAEIDRITRKRLSEED